MDKKQSVYFGVGVVLLVSVVAVLLIRSARWESPQIVLPENPANSAGLEDENPGSRLNVLEIAPETVQPAIATLSRPLSYSRSQTVETFWSGGSGQSVSQVYVSGGLTRLDTALPDGSVCHSLVSGTVCAVWYDEEEEYTLLRTRDFTADAAGRSLTYETVRDLPANRIALADYRARDGVECVYVETKPDDGGYVDRYWVSVEWGLLCAAERDCNGELIYRFSATAPASDPPGEDLFSLPDGSKLEVAE